MVRAQQYFHRTAGDIDAPFLQLLAQQPRSDPAARTFIAAARNGLPRRTRPFRARSIVRRVAFRQAFHASYPPLPTASLALRLIETIGWVDIEHFARAEYQPVGPCRPAGMERNVAVQRASMSSFIAHSQMRSLTRALPLPATQRL